MKTLLLTLMFFACANKQKEAAATPPVEETPCHKLFKMTDLGDAFRIVENCNEDGAFNFFKAKCAVVPVAEGAKVTCVDFNNNETNVVVTNGEEGQAGRSGSTGRPGATGPLGPRGPSGVEQVGIVCNHSRIHISRTLELSTSELVFQFWGFASVFDLPGACENPGVCECDQCPEFNPYPEIFHNLANINDNQGRNSLQLEYYQQ